MADAEGATLALGAIETEAAALPLGLALVLAGA
jgi:hypothetical protein